MPMLGAHMSIAGSPHIAFSRGKEAGCRVIQIFTRNRVRWVAKGLSDPEIEAFEKAREETSIVPIAVHASYLINIASPSRELREKALSLLVKEMEWASLLKIPFIVIHPGSHAGTGEKRGLRLAGDVLRRCLEDTASSNVGILLETTAGQGDNLGCKFEHFRDILKQNKDNERLGVCFDTCHAFASGYDFRTKYTYRQILNKFDNIIGLNRLKLFHINDSIGGLGSRVDRHTHPGKGLIGLKPFSFFLNDPVFNEHPFILETPKVKDPEGCDMDMINLKILNELIRER